MNARAGVSNVMDVSVCARRVAMCAFVYTHCCASVPKTGDGGRASAPTPTSPRGKGCARRYQNCISSTVQIGKPDRTRPTVTLAESDTLISSRVRSTVRSALLSCQSPREI